MMVFLEKHRLIILATIFMLGLVLYAYINNNSRFIILEDQDLAFSKVYSVKRSDPFVVYHSFSSDLKGTLYRLGMRKENISSFMFTASDEDELIYDFVRGVKTKTSYSLDTSDLKSGYYMVQGETSSGKVFAIPFVVYDPTCKGITVIAPSNTWIAYNTFVKGNYTDSRPLFFKIEDKALDIARRVFAINQQEKTLPIHLPSARPLTFAVNVAAMKDPKVGVGDLLSNEWQLIAALEMENIDYCVIDDKVFAYEQFYEKSDSFIFNGHSEYWSKGMIKQLDDLIASGKKILFTGGNNLYREIRVTEYGILVIRQRMDEEVTASRIGTFYDDRGFGTYAPMKVFRPSHWVFNRVKKDVIGHQSAYLSDSPGISGHETDKVSMYSDGFVVLARGINNDFSGGGDFVYRKTEGGWVINFSSLSFVGGYFADSDTKTVIHNILINMQM